MAMENDQENEKQRSEIRKFKIEEGWAIRPCFLYKEEYDDCRSYKARFHQYFVHGESTDCENWYRDYLNCQKYEESNESDLEAGKYIINSEKDRRAQRLKAHVDNNVWKKRPAPPQDWNKPLPEWLAKRNENSYLDIKQKEQLGIASGNINENDKSWCSIM